MTFSIWDLDMWTLIGLFCTSGLIGAIIGKTKGQAYGAFILAVLFGPFGWLIAFASKDKRPKCPECRGTVIKGARRCGHCGSELQARTRQAA